MWSSRLFVGKLTFLFKSSFRSAEDVHQLRKTRYKKTTAKGGFKSYGNKNLIVSQA